MKNYIAPGEMIAEAIRLVEGARDFVKKRLFAHDAVYNSNYYRQRREFARRSAAIIAKTLTEQLQPTKVIDVGCATGDLLESLQMHGVSATGLEYSRVAVRECQRRSLDVIRFDLERHSLPRTVSGDVFVCTEVAEHLPEQCADRLVNLLCMASKWVVFTAAPPGQGGLDHVNEQPKEYWVERFQSRGFVEDVRITKAWQQEWQGTEIAPWYWRNLMVFSRINL